MTQIPVLTRADTPDDAPQRKPKKRGTKSYLTYLGLAAIFVYCLSPFYWMLVSSFRRTADIFDNSLIPQPFSLENYLKVFDGSTMFGQALLNSLIVAGITTTAALVLGIFAAYAISRLNFRFKSVILGLVIATSMFPGISVVVPLLRLFTDIGWINTYQAMIVPNLSFAIPLAVWNLTTFMKALPFDLEEAAMIDGCTKWQAFRKILLPLAAPGVFTTAILTFIHSWNEFIIALSMINDPERQTATVAISKFTGATEFQAPFGEQMAAGVIVTVPLVIMVLIFQRRIVEGLTSGATK
ncbi:MULTISPECIES: carbohydrate ABC transporter permease [unclassified Arthrobacter]|uniref:carbohydrate ABC transporter permease n=1 Tax=unclassified Arthrobacter TaxID=235627 RepID=UPI001D152BBD|nr:MULTISPECIES: carbohydrate ABC transporter permease [unclassified Arthrobacter]MCC3289812.1 carbohydrate ABC transporter permease [Arthrobacter sp. zg-Y1110]MCC3300686.1 carbohydrate ABC transporter permease [Arthrobacter sp. zg-Y895]UWX84771.1 carbohydrate ABC transporter permease [Arthrobacter sp. zg-Y1110]